MRGIGHAAWARKRRPCENSPVESQRFRDAIRRIDAANADDPHTLIVDGEPRPKELTHAAMLTAWVRRLRPDAGEALLLAARAHHIRRWTIPRDEYPSGRRGYLRWRTALQAMHAAEVGRVLQEAGYGADEIARVQQLVRKHNLKRDPEVQSLEDGLCLVFLETQFADLRAQHPAAKIADIVQKTWRKMSPAARDLALELDLPSDDRAALEQALVGDSAPSA